MLLKKINIETIIEPISPFLQCFQIMITSTYACHLTKLFNSMFSNTLWKEKHECDSWPESNSLILWSVFVQDIWTVIRSPLQVSNRMCRWLSEYSSTLQICVPSRVGTCLYWLPVELQFYENCFGSMYLCVGRRALLMKLECNGFTRCLKPFQIQTRAFLVGKW